MKKYRYIILGILIVSTFSCSDSFLEEKMVSTITQDYLETENGLDGLVVSSYNAERIRFDYAEGLYMFETGHDCSMRSANSSQNEYSTSVWSSTGDIATWTNYFMGFQSKQQSGFNINCFPIIDNCNKGITAIRSGTASGKYASDADYAAQRLSELLFNRDYLFYSLNTLLGDIPVSTISITSMPSNYYYPRVPSEELYKMMISDLRFAVEHLPESYDASNYGRITKYAAAHFLSMLYLQRAQGAEYGTSTYGRNSDGTIDNSNPNSYLGMLYKGNVSTDLDSCIFYSSMVINKYILEPEYADIFKHGLDDYSNESSSEIILPALFANGTDNYRYGTRICSFMVGNYVNSLWGIPDYTWENPTKSNFFFLNNDHAFDLFTDKINDSRYQGSFQLEFKTALRGGNSTSTPAADIDYYAYNNSSNTSYVWTADQAAYFNTNILPAYNRISWGGRTAVAGQHKMGTGDIAFAFLENTKATAIDVDEANAQPFVLFARWMKKGGEYYYRPQIITSSNTYSFVNSTGTSTNFYGLENSGMTGIPTSSKYNDPNRNSYKDLYGTRDVPVFRLAQAYLIRAEAYGRQGHYELAIPDINAIRRRAAFKSGDTRDEVLARLYPGHESLPASDQSYPYTVSENSDLDVDATYWDGASAHSIAENYPPSATTSLQRFIQFICNEYGREFNQEIGPYYEEVHHAGVQAERILWYDQLGSSASSHKDWGISDNVTPNGGQDGSAKGSFQNSQTLKPFPETQFLDLLTDKNGKVLDNVAKTAYQNYGY